MLCCVVSFVKEYLLFYDVRQDVLQLCYAVMCHTTFYTECVYTQPCIERPWNTTTSAPHHPVRQQHPIQTQYYIFPMYVFTIWLSLTFLAELALVAFSTCTGVIARTCTTILAWNLTSTYRIRKHVKLHISHIRHRDY